MIVIIFYGCLDTCIAAMEDIPEVYHRLFNADKPVVCMDETNKQLVSSARESLQVVPEKPLRVDNEYFRHSVADIFMAVEPIAGRRFVSINERRTRTEWTIFIKDLLDNKYPEANKVVLMMDNLNTHKVASLYETFPPEEALNIANHPEIYFTPKHDSWLNIDEIKLSALVGQCLNKRIPNIETMRSEVATWKTDRNNKGAYITWRFTTEDTRVKLKRLYQKI